MTDPLAAFRLDGRLAVVTGAASGIGRAAAALYAAAGARVVLADRDGIALAAAADAIGPGAHPVILDLTEPGAPDRLADTALRIAPINIWANVAGIAAATPIETVDRATYDRIVAINLDALFWCCAAAAARMRPRRQGVIINISSNAADQPMLTLSVYAMTKAAVNMLTRSLAAELGPDGIRVNAIAPGFTVTPMTAGDHLSPSDRQALVRRNAARAPLGLAGEPADMAHAMLYLASDASRFMTGQILRVNGGTSMP